MLQKPPDGGGVLRITGFQKSCGVQSQVSVSVKDIALPLTDGGGSVAGSQKQAERSNEAESLHPSAGVI